MIKALKERVIAMRDALQAGTLARAAVLPYRQEILDLQREQLAEGKSASGEDIRPYYSEDLKPSGYFYSTQTARNYAAWKESLGNPYEAGRRNFDAPNLYITGKFYDEIGVDFGGDRMQIVGTTPFAAGIIAKYGSLTFGLLMSNWMRIFDAGAYQVLMSEIKRVLYG